MSDWIFELYSVGNVAKETELDVSDGMITEALAGEHTLRITVNPFRNELEQYVGTTEDASLGIAILSNQKYIRVTSLVSGISDYFIIRSAEKQRSGDNLVIAVECEHHKYQLIDRVARVKNSYSQISASEYLNLIMPYAPGFTVTENDIPTTILRDVDIDYPTVLAAIKYLCDTWTQFDGTIERKFFPLIDKGGNIRIKREDAIGSTAPYPLICDHNIPGIRKSISGPNANKIYYTGLDNTLAYADSLPIVDAAVTNTTLIYSSGFIGGTFTVSLDDAGGNANPVAWDSVILIKLNSPQAGSWASASGSYIVNANIELLTAANALVGSREVALGEVTYPNRATGNSKWFAFRTGDNSSVKKIRVTATAVSLYNSANPQFIAIQREGLEYELGPNLDYVEDLSSQSSYGLIETRLENREHPKVLNIIRNFKASGGATITWDSSLSGLYTGGVCEVFRTIGAPFTKSENTNTNYIINGSKSQYALKSAFLASGFGLAAQPPRMAEGWTYQVWLQLFVIAGRIKIDVSLGYPWTSGSTMLFTHQTAGIGWLQVLTETGFGLPSGTGASAFDIAIYSEAPAEWYIDSLCCACTPDAIEYYKTNSANVLKDEATRILRLNKDPRTQYDVDLADLAQMDAYYAGAIYNVGDDAIIRDPRANISTQAKIYRSTSDLFDPTKRKLTLADRSIGAAEMISLISNSKSLRGL